MADTPERRTFLGIAMTGVAGAALGLRRAERRAVAGITPGFPRQEAEMVEEMLKVSHGGFARVKQLLDAHPALAKAAIDWGFGDWEDALGAASHVGRADIAELLLARGARPTLFSATMLGQLDTVKAIIAAAPGSQRILGPHSLTLLHHARVGGERARGVRQFLEQLGDADAGPPLAPVDAGAVSACVGTYTFGTSPNDRLDITSSQPGALSIFRPGLPFPRDLRHLGDFTFFPIGAEAVRIRFTVAGGRATAVSVLDPDLVVTATRSV